MISFRKNTLRIFALSLFLMILTNSCAQVVGSNELLENETALKLTTYLTDSISTANFYNLEMDSLKVNELRKWIDNNKTGWKKSITSFAQPSISVIGDDFRMLIFKNFVVVGFTNKKGKLRQFTKQTAFNDFEFLLRE